MDTKLGILAEQFRIFSYKDIPQNNFPVYGLYNEFNVSVCVTDFKFQ